MVLQSDIFFHLGIYSGVIRLVFILLGFCRARDAHSSEGGSDDTLVGPFGTLCGDQLSCQLLLLLRCLF